MREEEGDRVQCTEIEATNHQSRHSTYMEVLGWISDPSKGNRGVCTLAYLVNTASSMVARVRLRSAFMISDSTSKIGE